MFAHCESPLWDQDDFSHCFRRDFLQVLLPLIVCGVSLLVLVVQTTLRIIGSRRRITLKSIDNPKDSCDVPIDVLDDEVFSSDESSYGENEESRVLLQRTKSRDTTYEVEWNRPRGVTFLATLELLGTLGETLIHLAAFVAQERGHNVKIAEVSSLSFWAYTFTLVCLRTKFPKAKHNPFPNLWNHTAVLYCLRWLFTVVLFRSAIVHPQPKGAQTLVIVDFILSTLLALIAISMRKGNKAVLMRHEKDLEPSREPLASLLSMATFSWVDTIVWEGYKKPFEIKDIWNLMLRDKATNVLAEYRQLRKTTRLSLHLLRFFKRELAIQMCWATLSASLTFMPTLVLKSILEYVEHPEETPAATAWLLVILMTLAGVVSAVADNQGLWIGRKICIQIRAIMVAEVYAKTLRRKAAVAGETDLSGDEKKSDQVTDKLGLKQKLTRLVKKEKADGTPKETANATRDSQVNSGTIINLMSVDAFKVAEVSAYLHFLIPTVPIQLTVAITLLYQILGWSSIAGLAVMVCLIPLNLWFASRFSGAHKRIMASTDKRIHTTNEILQNIRIIKYFAWEDLFAQKINDKRVVEIRNLRYRFIIWTLATISWVMSPLLITGFSFFLFTVVEKRELLPSVAFTALSLFSLLRYPLDHLADMVARVQESKISIDRVDRFLNEDETEKHTQLSATPETEGDDPKIGFENATFTWAGKEEEWDKADRAFQLIDMDVQFHVGCLNVVAGPTGSGKSSLLMALLGEMTLLRGRVHLPGGRSREDLQVDPNTGLTESVAYCAQQAWLINDTIKQNILFASPFDESRYHSVIDACALARDLEVLDDGDSTLVGEKGIVVSGGQKQRISLARALYSNSRHVLLDDCLSAVDSHTAQHIFEQCILGPLMFKRTCILVTHNLALCVPLSHHVVVLANGKITAQGSPQAIMSSGVLGEDMLKSRPTSKSGTRMHSRTQSSMDCSAMTPTDGNGANGKSNGHIDGKNTEPESSPKVKNEVENANSRTEGKAEGAVAWPVIKLYLSSMGPWYFWFLILFAYTLDQCASVSTNLWIREWANSYHYSELDAEGTNESTTSTYFTSITGSTYLSAFGLSRTLYLGFPMSRRSADGLVETSETSDVDNGYYLEVFVLLGLAYMIVALFKSGVLYKGSLNASRAIHSALLTSVLRAKFKFFDTTPLGQIMNRFSKDLQAIDQDLVTVAGGVMHTMFQIVIIITLISVITPGFLIVGVVLTAVYFAIGMFYVRSSRDLKRLESVQRSPLYQQFGETLSGIITIRAYGDERRFIRDNFARINAHNRPFLYLWAANRWLATRVDFAGALVSFFAGAFVVLKVKDLDAGAAGLSLTYALTFNENILWLVRLYAESEQNLNHVERVKVLLDVEQEAKAHVPENKPPGNWPSKGSLEFIDYSTRYRANLDPVLKNLNIKIKAQDKVGIVGRTGAGKSSLALALFRGLEADEGKILIDDVDIGQIGLQDLRENINLVPQDPTLFTGTIRENLDPFGLFTDEEIFQTLRRVHLIGSDDTSTPSTPSAISSSSTAVENPLDMLASVPLTDPNVPPSLIHNSSVPSSNTIITLDAPPSFTKATTTTRENANVFLNLSSPIAESGSNLSQGQRQLLCLARALLKSPRVLLMDEATASIDYATDAKIQETLRELTGSTIITIAHRLQTIIDYDMVLVLEKGEVVEYDRPEELIKREGGVFRGMCEMSGDFEGLVRGAEKAEEKRRLVDVDG